MRFSLFFVGLLCVSFFMCGKSKDVQEESAIKAGAYYFDGWSFRTDRLKTEFADREPVWGWEDGTQEIMDQQIDLAADNGLDFWAFDWYYPESDTWRGQTGLTYKTHPLNEALYLFFNSTKNDRLEFCLLVANHGSFRIFAKDWEKVTDIWIDYFKHEKHLKIDNKPFVIIYHPHQLVETFNGPEGLREAFNILRNKSKAAGFDGVFLAACTTQPREDYIKAGYDGFTGYNYRGASGSMLNLARGDSTSFEQLAAMHEKIWDHFLDSPLPYIPIATLGWDNRPRNPEKNMQKPFFWFSEPTPDEIAVHVQNAIEWIQENPEQTVEEKLVLLYSWNEVAEGAYLVPTKSKGDVVLQRISGVLD